MAKNLVIVESPAKAKTIEGYLGTAYKVLSSYGHVRDLPKGNKAIDIENNFTPTYEITADKKEVIQNLEKWVAKAEQIYLASDDDREGEAISWHLKEVLGISKPKRIVFREITKDAIQKAINDPREIDQNLVNSQQARRVLDRLVGFELSPILWRKIKAGLSAGRVQSVAVRMVVERERDIQAFKPTVDYRTKAWFTVGEGLKLEASLHTRFTQEAEVKEFLEHCLSAKFSIAKIEKKNIQRKPGAPFTTSTLQQEASQKMGFSVARTMSMAQKLYEAGKISYMRTDSVYLSQDAIQSAAQQIRSAYGDNYLEIRQYKGSSSAQEAHEAIRPTDFSARQVSENEAEQKLYNLIWRRAIASQMAVAQIEKTQVQISVSDSKQYFVAQGEVLKFEGFLSVYYEDKEAPKDLLPPISMGQALPLESAYAREMFSKYPPRYTEASLVKNLETMGIGRPSTYAPTISTIQKRNYVEKANREGKTRNYISYSLKQGSVVRKEETEITGAEKNKLFPTNVAMVVNDFLVDRFPKVTNYSFTADVEKEFDRIAQGQCIWNEMIKGFYQDFHSKVEASGELDVTTINKPRILGKDPKTGREILVRMGRYGAMAQMGTTEDGHTEKPKMASLRKNQFLESISFEEALELFKLPRKLGLLEEEEVVANIGRFGPYVKYKGKFVSLPKEEDPHEITLERAIEIIRIKQEADANKLIQHFEEAEISILNGRYGPYIKTKDKNVKIPKDTDPKTLNLEDCLKLIEEMANKPKRKPRKKN